MPEEGLAVSVQQFIRAHIRSIEELEVLKTLRSNPTRAWTVGQIYDVVLTNRDSIANRLQNFCEGGLVLEMVSEPGTYRFAPRTAELARAADETLEAYHTRSVLVLETIFKPSNESARNFAEAFRFKRK